MIGRHWIAAFLGLGFIFSAAVGAEEPQLRPASGLSPSAAEFQTQQAAASLRTGKQLTPQGILSPSPGHKHGSAFTRALGGAAADVGHATLALMSCTVFNQSIDLPPDDASKPEWPFNEPSRKALFYMNWADGTQSKISRLPDGTVQILGGGRRYVMQPESDGSFAMMGDFGSMASVVPRAGGGYTINKADGTIEVVLPREGGGFVVSGKNGVVATIIPGMAGSKHVRGSGYSSGFLQ